MEAAKTLKKELENDRRNLGDLWVAAMSKYQGIMGFKLERKYENLADITAAGTLEMENFHKWRHNQGKVDRLRTLLSQNPELVELGTQQLVSAATTSFPPAVAIGTALAHLLGACREQSGDYDIVETFFEDMNGFLSRAKIIESRVPQDRGWQNCLMEVFTSLLEMTGIATKFVELGRFKKWIMKILEGDDSELSSARNKLAKNIDRLKDATELAILGNTEDLSEDLAKMNRELSENQKLHDVRLEEQKGILLEIMHSNQSVKADMAMLLRAMEEQRREKFETADLSGVAADREGERGEAPTSANLIRNALPFVDTAVAEYHVAKETLVEGSCRWLFSEPRWMDWILRDEQTPRPPLVIEGPSGVGKSHLAVVIYDELVTTQKKQNDHIAVSHFYFREHRPGHSVFRNAIYTMVDQISRQSASFCDAFCAQFNINDNDINVADWKEVVSKLLTPTFGKDRDGQLFIVFDGVDELRKGEELDMVKFIDEIRKQEVKIHVLFTTRKIWGVQDLIGDKILLSISPDKQSSTLKMMVWHRLNSLWALRRFSRYGKQRIADKTVQVSPNLLYATHLLERLNEIGREGGVLDELESLDEIGRESGPLDELETLQVKRPATIQDLYESLLRDCERRTPNHLHGTVSELFSWVAFSLRPLLLNEIISLIRYLSGEASLNPEDLPHVFSKFLVIGDSVAGREDTEVSMAELEAVQKQAATSNLRVDFREREMRQFFRRWISASMLVYGKTDSHRRIFLSCARITAGRLSAGNGSSDPGIDLDPGLKAYAAAHALKHLLAVSSDGLDDESNIEVMEELGGLLSNKFDFAMALQESEARLSDVFSEEVIKHIRSWSDCGATKGYYGARLEPSNSQQALSAEIAKWWEFVSDSELSKVRRKLFLELAKASLRRLYSSDNRMKALLSYRSAIFFLGVSYFGKDLAQQAKVDFDITIGKDSKDGRTIVRRSEASLGIRLSFDGVEPDLDATGYQAHAEILLHYRHNDAAQKTCKKSLSVLSHESAVFFRLKTLEILARSELATKKLDAARDHIEECLELTKKATLPPRFLRAIYLTRARIQRSREDPLAAAESYGMSRAADPSGTTSGDILDEEVGLVFGQEQESQSVTLFEILRSLNALDRLTWMTWDWLRHGHEKHSRLRLIAPRDDHQRASQALGWYTEAIRYLDDVHAGAPLRYYLAKFHIDISQDYESARAILDEILDSDLIDINRRGSYRFTEEDPSQTLHRAIHLQSDVVFHLFSRSTEPTVKDKLLQDAKMLPERPLAREASLFSNTAHLYHRLLVARMVRKIGLPIEFQQLLDGIIADSRAALRDGVAWNDTVALGALSNALVLLAEAVPSKRSELWKAARIMVSARLETELDVDKSVSDKEDDDDDAATSNEENSDDDGTTSNEEDSDDDAATSNKEDDNGDTATSDKEDDDDNTAISDVDDDGDFPESDEEDDDDDFPSDDEEEGGTGEGDDERDVQDDEYAGNKSKYKFRDSGMGQIRCEGWCIPRSVFRAPNKNEDRTQQRVSFYQCTVCCDVAFCEACYNKASGRGNGDDHDNDTAAATEHGYGRMHCKHKFIRAPTEGWGGIRAGRLAIEGESSVKFKDSYLDGRIPELVQESWEEFWRGG